MGEMTIRNLDDALLVELEREAASQGLGVDDFAAELLRTALRRGIGNRAGVARAIQAAQAQPSPLDSVDLIREDRNRGCG